MGATWAASRSSGARPAAHAREHPRAMTDFALVTLATPMTAGLVTAAALLVETSTARTHTGTATRGWAWASARTTRGACSPPAASRAKRLDIRKKTQPSRRWTPTRVKTRTPTVAYGRRMTNAAKILAARNGHAR